MWCYLVLNRSSAGSSAPSSPPGTVMSPESPPVSGFYYGLIKAVTERCPRRVMPLRGLSAGVGPLEPYRLAPEAAAKYRRLFVREHRFGRTSWRREEEAEPPRTCVRLATSRSRCPLRNCLGLLVILVKGRRRRYEGNGYKEESHSNIHTYTSWATYTQEQQA